MWKSRTASCNYLTEDASCFVFVEKADDDTSVLTLCKPNIFYRAMLCIVQTMLSQLARSHAGIVLKRLNISSNIKTFFTVE